MSKIRQIIESYVSKTALSGAVRKKFGEWLEDERDREEKNKVLTELWNGLNSSPDLSTWRSYHKLQKSIERQESGRIRPLFPKRKAAWIAAAILLLPVLSVGLGYLLTGGYARPETALTECIVPNGEMRSVILPDSTRVQLNAGSILIYPERFGKERKVYLNGEGYFDVAQNADSRFIVSTSDMEVEAIGTVFNVSCYISNELSSATLECGKVNVRLKGNAEADYFLSPGEQLFIDKRNGIAGRKEVDVESVIAWTKGNLVIRSLPLSEIARIIERRFDVEVCLNSKKYDDERITLKLGSGEGVTDMMDILQHLISGLNYKFDNGKLYIY